MFSKASNLTRLGSTLMKKCERSNSISKDISLVIARQVSILSSTNSLQRTTKLCTTFQTRKISKDKNERFVIKDFAHEKIATQDFTPKPLSSFPKDSSHPTLIPTHEFENRELMSFDGLKYTELPIITIHAKYNNTHICFTDAKGKPFGSVTSKTAGFFNAKKKTPHAGEMTGKLAAERAIERGLTNKVRVVVKGIGVGRRSAIKGLMMGGMEVVSITDKTPLYMAGLPQRPRKVRRI